MVTTVHQNTFYLLLLLLSFCFLSFVNEVRGVTLSETSVGFPRRVSPAIPFLSFGRKSLDIHSIYQLQVIKNSGMTRNYRERKLDDNSIRRCILITNQFEMIEIFFPDKSQRDLFSLTLDIHNPGLTLTRRVAPPKFFFAGQVISGVNFVLALLTTAALALPLLAEQKKHLSANPMKTPLLLRTVSDELETEGYMIYAATYDWGTTTRNKVKKKLQELQICSGVNLKINTNLEYKFLTPPTKRWSITAGPYPQDKVNIIRDKLISCGASDLEVKEAENEE